MTDDGQLLDGISFQGILLDNAESLHGFVLRRIPGRLQTLIAPEDVLQEVWGAAYKARAGFTPDGPDSVSRWLTRIAERELIDAIRRVQALKRRAPHARREAAHIKSSSFLDLFARVASPRQRTPSSEDAAKEATRAVQIALCSLPDDYRCALTMFHIDGHSLAEVAKRMDRTKPAVNSLLYRGRRMLREQLGPAGRFFSEARSSQDV